MPLYRPDSPIRIYANPYDTSASGFYFSSVDEFNDKQKSNRNSSGMPVEEYSFEYISGDGQAFELFNAMNDGGFINLELYFGILALASYDDREMIPKIIHASNLGESIEDMAEDGFYTIASLSVYDGSPSQYVDQQHIEEVFDPTDLAGLSDHYIDFKSLGRTLEADGYRTDSVSQQNPDYLKTLGMEIFETEFDENLSNAPYDPLYYIDVSALARDMQISNQLTSMVFDDKVITIVGELE